MAGRTTKLVVALVLMSVVLCWGERAASLPPLPPVPPRQLVPGSFPSAGMVTIPTDADMPAGWEKAFPRGYVTPVSAGVVNTLLKRNATAYVPLPLVMPYVNVPVDPTTGLPRGSPTQIDFKQYMKTFQGLNPQTKDDQTFNLQNIKTWNDLRSWVGRVRDPKDPKSKRFVALNPQGFYLGDKLYGPTDPHRLVDISQGSSPWEWGNTRPDGTPVGSPFYGRPGPLSGYPMAPFAMPNPTGGPFVYPSGSPFANYPPGPGLTSRDSQGGSAIASNIPLKLFSGDRVGPDVKGYRYGDIRDILHPNDAGGLFRSLPKVDDLPNVGKQQDPKDQPQQDSPPLFAPYGAAGPYYGSLGSMNLNGMVGPWAAGAFDAQLNKEVPSSGWEPPAGTKYFPHPENDKLTRAGGPSPVHMYQQGDEHASMVMGKYGRDWGRAPLENPIWLMSPSGGIVGDPSISMHAGPGPVPLFGVGGTQAGEQPITDPTQHLAAAAGQTAGTEPTPESVAASVGQMGNDHMGYLKVHPPFNMYVPPHYSWVWKYGWNYPRADWPNGDWPFISGGGEALKDRKSTIPDEWVEVCPNKCSGHGVCELKARRCNCFQGYTGEDCSLVGSAAEQPASLSATSSASVRHVARQETSPKSVEEAKDLLGEEKQHEKTDDETNANVSPPTQDVAKGKKEEKTREK